MDYSAHSTKSLTDKLANMESQFPVTFEGEIRKQYLMQEIQAELNRRLFASEAA
jgi:hypothetical protein